MMSISAHVSSASSQERLTTRARAYLGSTWGRVARRLARPVLEAVEQSSATVYTELEALLGIYITLGIERPLPAMRGWPISPDFGREVVSLILRKKPASVLELGSGVSTVVVGYALKKNGSGKLVSVDHDGEWLRKTRDLVQDHGLADWVTLVHAPLTAVTVDAREWTWYDPTAIRTREPIDLLVVDGPPLDTQPLARYPALAVLRPRLAEDAVIILDDADRADEQAILSRWMANCPDLSVSSPATEKGCAVLGGSAVTEAAHD